MPVFTDYKLRKNVCEEVCCLWPDDKMPSVRVSKEYLAEKKKRLK